jgi:hypothetical protein
MAATKGLNPVQQERIRAQIKTTQLVKRLQAFALGERDPTGRDQSNEAPALDIDPGRLKAIEILLRKSLPDLSAVSITGKDGGPVQTEEVGQGAAKLAAVIDAIASRTTGGA